MTQKSLHSICIIAFSTIRHDARVLRQIKYLSPHYDVIVVGYGAPEEKWATQGGIRWYPLDTLESFPAECSFTRMWRRLINSAILGLGRFRPLFYERWYWSKRHHAQALEYAIQSHCDALLANDWEALPVAVEAATRTGAKLVFDSHEYAPLEFGNLPSWRFFFRRAIVHFLKKYSSQIDASVAAWPVISERYRREFGFEPLVLLNAPESVLLDERPLDFDHVRLVHHGVAIKGRRLENMIMTLATSHPRFQLHFILIEGDSGYLDELKELAERRAPGRIFFENPVQPEEIVERISEYDIGFYLLAPTSFNNQMSLPNKLFDYIAAGLAVFIGPSPSMAEIVRQYGLGWVAPSFEPKDVTETLNQITYDQLLHRRLASRDTAKKFDAVTEMTKLVNIFDRFFCSTHSL